MAQQLPDLYSLLGIRPDASEEEIKRAYRRLAREYHPDVSKDPDAEARFKEINAAYETLKDPIRRRQYDLFGAGGGAAGGVFPFGDMGDIFDVFFGGGFGGGRRPRSRRRSRTRRGDDLFVPMSLTFEEAVFGVKREVVVETLVRCERCNGSGCEPGTHPSRCGRCGGSGEIQDVARSVFGTVMTARPCTTCEGTGEEIAAPCGTCDGESRVAKEQSFTVEVPAGVADGMELRVPDGGQDGRFGAAPGDLYVSLRVKPHPVFERRGQDLACELPISMTQAVLGADLVIPTLDGEGEHLRIDPGMQSGTVVKLRSRGIPHIGRRARGDLFVTITVETPRDLTKEERALIERLAELRGEPSRKGQRRQAGLRKRHDS
jgi:molecular chaperone DnaJ